MKIDKVYIVNSKTVNNNANIGDEITLKINRNGFEKTLKIKLTK